MTDVRQATWRLNIDGMDYPSPNKRGGWQQRHQLTKAWRNIVGWLAKAEPIPSCHRIHVRLHYHPRVDRRRDADNLVLAQKAAVDGLVDAGIIPDDTPRYVDWSRPVIHDADGQPARFELVVSDIG